MHLLPKQYNWLTSFGYLACLLMLACQGSTDAPLPIKRVYVQVYLNTIETLPLKNPPSYIYIKNEGLRGIALITDQQGSYIALDRNCSYRSDDSCAVVNVDPSLQFLTCRCCGSRFSIFGQYQNGAASNPLRRYNVLVQANVLTITN